MPEQFEHEILRAAIACDDYKRVRTEDGRGVQTVADGKTLVTYLALVDARAVALMAEKAHRNKSGKSTAGPVTVKILKREKLGVEHGR